jgi:hypothetical protein
MKTNDNMQFKIKEEVLIMSPTSRWKGKTGIIEKYYSRSGWYGVKVNGVSSCLRARA